jgi:drug/metabolite transporter (DMT)-like permease
MRPRDLVELLALAALWGMSFLFMRVGVPEFGAVPLTAMRIAGAALCLLPLLFVQAHRAPLRRHWRTIAFLGVIHSAIPFMLFALAALAIDTGLSAIFNATTSMWAALIAWVWLGEALDRSRVLGLLIGFLGVVGLAWDKANLRPGEHGVSAAVAIAACLAAALCYGLSANYAKRKLPGVPPLLVAAGSQLGAALALALPAWHLWPAAMPGARSWASVAALAVLCTAAAYILYYRLLAHVGAAKASTVTLLVPLFAVVWGAVFLSETLTPTLLVFCAVILLGTALTTGVLRWPSSGRRRDGAPGAAGNP